MLVLRLSDALGLEADFLLSLEENAELTRLQTHHDRIEFGLDHARKKLEEEKQRQTSIQQGREFSPSAGADDELAKRQAHLDRVELGLKNAKKKLEDEKQRQSSVRAQLSRVTPHKKLRFYFLHIKKCAGTTLIGLAGKQAHVTFHHPHANGNPIIEDTDLSENTKLSNTAKFYPFWNLDKPEQRDFLRKNTHNFIANEGHLGKNFETLDEMIYFTILRNPIKRTISHFHHTKHLNSFEETLNSFVLTRASKTKWANNFMIFQIMGVTVREYDKEATDAAISRLDMFDHVLLQEYLADDLDYFKNYGWDLSELKNRNVRSGVSNRDVPSDEALKLLTHLNQSDAKLYDYFLNKRARISEV